MLLDWQFDEIKITEYLSDKIVVERTLNLPDIGSRVWEYSFNRSNNIYKQTEKITLNNSAQAVVNKFYDGMLYSKGCKGQAYPTTFRFWSGDGDITTKFINIKSPLYPWLSVVSNPCNEGNRNGYGGTLYTRDHSVDYTALDFKTIMEHVKWTIEVLEWTPSNIKFVGQENNRGDVLGFHIIIP